MTESNTEIKEGTYEGVALVEDYISDELIPMWSPVILVAAGTGEDMPRIEPINSVSVDVIGVAVDRQRSKCITPILTDAPRRLFSTRDGQSPTR